jgi:hypothetical protein
MANPSEKSEKMEQTYAGMVGFDRREYIRSDVCIPKPYGCEGPAVNFVDDLSRKEYTISGLCQKCQDKTFGIGDED